MAKIGPALDFTLANEGGFSDHPADHGGATKYGITKDDYEKWIGHEVSRYTIQNMHKTEAEKIYNQFYWRPLNLDQVESQAIATCIFDMGVLCGISRSAKWAQDVCNVTQDGMFGPVTIEHLNSMDVDRFVAEFAATAALYFHDIVKRNQSQKVFLKGWTARAARLRTLHDNGPSPKPQEEQAKVESSATPWRDWFKARLGWTEFDHDHELSKGWKYTHHCKHYTSVIGADHAWCGMSLATALTENGYKIPVNCESAAGWIGYGTKIVGAFPKGAVVVIQHHTGGHHVTTANRDHKNGEAILEALGGNQNSSIKVSNFIRSPEHDKIVWVGWPVKA